MNEWIPVKDALPGIGIVVLVLDRLFIKTDIHDFKYGKIRQPGVRFGVRYESGAFRSEGVNGRCDITHWMPVPQPPNDQ